jgi:hypothetical protein
VAKTVVYNNLGPASVPQEIKDLRRSSLDFHRTMGQTVVHKHRWNERDVREGRAQHCPYHSQAYQQDREWDQYCFGTGYLGGFADGVITYVTIGDTDEDVFTLSDQGALLYERHPGLVAPWTPLLGDGDLIIVAELAPNGHDIVELGDRYELREVSPITMRGPNYKNTVHTKPYIVNQEAQIDLLPYGHELYTVPIVFDYESVPTDIPIDYDPSDYPAGTLFGSYETAFRFIGAEVELDSQHEHDIRIAVVGTDTEYTTDIRLTGKPGGTHIEF